MWILVSAGDRGAFPGMNAVTVAMEQAGAHFSRYHWDGTAPNLEALAERAAAEPGNLKYTVFDADTVIRGADSSPGANHGGTWAVVYSLPPLLRWLLRQVRAD